MAFFSQPITVSADDGQHISTGSFSNAGTAVNVGETGLVWEGLFVRFQLNRVPQGSIITNANIQFEASSPDSTDVCRGKITADQADDAAAPLSSGQYIAGRQNFGTELTWLPPDQSSGDMVRTDDDVNIDVVIQEIVSRAGWVVGNHIVLFVDDSEDNESDGGANRSYATFNHLTREAPILSFNYTEVEEFIAVVHDQILIPGRHRVM